MTSSSCPQRHGRLRPAHQLAAPEVEEVCLLLTTAVEVIPDVAPVLVLDAVTGMRRGELVTIRRTDLRFSQLEIIVRGRVGPSAGSDGRFDGSADSAAETGRRDPYCRLSRLSTFLADPAAER